MKRGTISIFWSDDDQEYVATHSDYPSLSWLEPTIEGAVHGLLRLLTEKEGL